MEQAFNNFKVEISLEELKKTLLEYYLNSNKAVEDVIIDFSSSVKYLADKNDEGEWRHYACGNKLECKITIIQQQNLLGENKKTEQKLILDERNINDILNYQLKKENLKMFRGIDYNEQKSSVSFTCTRLISKKEQELEKFEKYVDESDYLGVLFLMGEKTAKYVKNKTIKTLRKIMTK